MKIFVSHSSHQKLFVRDLRTRLPDAVQLWIDEREIAIGDPIDDSLERAISDSDFFLLVVDGHAARSEWVRREIAWALEHEASLDRPFFLPIVLEKDAWQELSDGKLDDRKYLWCADLSEGSLAGLANQLSSELFTLLARAWSRREEPGKASTVEILKAADDLSRCRRIRKCAGFFCGSCQGHYVGAGHGEMNDHPPFRLVVTDIDGTLVGSDKKVAERTRSQISRIAREYGVRTVLASARMPQAMATIHHLLGIKTPVVAYDGALVLLNPFSCESGSIRLSEGIAVKIAQEVVKNAKNLQLHVGIFSADRWLVEKVDYWARREIKGTGVTPTLGSIEDFLENEPIVHKIMLRGESEHIDDVFRTLANTFARHLRLSRSKGTLVEMVGASAGKKRGISAVLVEFGIAPGEVIGFGDGMNDEEFLSFVGYGVAMGNALASVKRVANRIAPTNDEYGVAATLEAFFPAKVGFAEVA